MTFIPHPGYLQTHSVADLVSGALKRVFNAIYRSRRRHAQQEIERYLGDRYPQLMTDALDREISNRMLGGSWTNRR